MSESPEAKYYRGDAPLPKRLWPKSTRPKAVKTVHVPRYVPDNPDCKVCGDTGSKWIQIKAGRSRLVTCECKE